MLIRVPNFKMSSVTETVKQVTCSIFNSLSLSKDNKLGKTFQLMILQLALQTTGCGVKYFFSVSVKYFCLTNKKYYVD